MSYYNFDVDKLIQDYEHCKKLIDTLESSNECVECIDSHKRLLEYMEFCIKYVSEI